MKIELKSLKTLTGDETVCFEAWIYIDGKKAAWVSNDGHGGCNLYRFMDRELEKKFHEFCAAQMSDAFEAADCYLEQLMLAMQDEKTIKRRAKANAKKGFPFTMVYKVRHNEYMYDLVTSGLRTKESAANVVRDYNVTVPYKVYDANGKIVQE
jgi:hypothetical protein